MQSPSVPLPDHARWRYLLSTDGNTASCRFGKVLGANSVVVKVSWVPDKGEGAEC